MKYGDDIEDKVTKIKFGSNEPTVQDQNSLLAMEQIFVKREKSSTKNISRQNSSELEIFLNDKDPELAEILRRTR